MKAKEQPIQDLICACCGEWCRGRQWWNRDTGYGLCNKCEKSVLECYKRQHFSEKESLAELQSCYGRKGYHYDLKDYG